MGEQEIIQLIRDRDHRGMDQLLEQARILGRTAEQVGSLDEAARALRELGGLERTEGT